ncbi:subtilisin-like protein, partial [Zopfia rhizophila CBS 207.26]
MCFLFILLFYAEMVLSNPSPDIWARGVETLSNLNLLASRDTSLTVYPTEPQNTGQLLEIHKFLKGLYGEERVKFNPQDGSLSWSISLHNGDTSDALQGHPGLRLGEETEESKRSEVVKRDDPYYIAIAANPDDDEQTKATREFLNSKVKNPNQEIIELHKPGTDHVMAWGNLQLTSDAKAAVEGYEGIKAPLGDDSEVTDERAVTTDEYLDVRTAPRSDEFWFSRRASKSVEKRASPVKRAVTYTKQEGAPAHLVMISQPKEMKDDKLKDFVYDQSAGIGTYIYVIDSGAAYNVKNVSSTCFNGDKEFERVEPLQTQHSKDDGEKNEEDGSAISHGTLVSSQAVGRKYGVAKAATLVSVKLRSKDRRIIDFLQGLETVTKHLEGKPDRHAKSVVISSLGFKSQMTPEKAKTDPDAGLMRTYFDSLFEMGVPFVSSSGNLGDLFKTIDRLPKVLEDKDTPIINVGAVDMDGNKPQMSQDGPQLTISAPGIGVTGQTKEEGKEGSQPGTSHAAPLVAGVISTYLNYDPPPWDGSKTGKERVQAIKDFIGTDASSWARKDERVIWNGAKKADHQAAGAS